MLLGRLQEDTQEQHSETGTADQSDGIVDLISQAHGSPQQAQALRSCDEVGHGDSGHEGCGDGADPVILLVLEQIHGSSPQSNHSQSLVSPGEVTPNDGVVDLADQSADAQDGSGQQHALLPVALVDAEPVGDGQTGAAVSGITGGDGAGDDTQHSQNASDLAHGGVADLEDNSVDTGTCIQQSLGILVEGNTGSSPDQSNDAFSHHGAVEDLVALLFRGAAAGHHGGLGSVEAGDSAAGHGQEHEGPDVGALGMVVAEVVPQLGHLVITGEQQNAGNTEGHEQQAEAEDRIDLADHSIDGNEGSDEVVDDDDPQPEVGIQVLGSQHSQQAGGTLGEDDTDHNQQDHGEDAHDGQHGLAQVDTGDLRDGCTFVAHGNHAGKVVVNTTGKDGTEDDPKINNGSEQSTVQSAEDGAQTGNVQQLDQEDSPALHGDEVNTVIDGDCRGFTVVRSEDFIHILAVEDKANQQDGDCNDESKHNVPPLFVVLRGHGNPR